MENPQKAFLATMAGVVASRCHGVASGLHAARGVSSHLRRGPGHARGVLLGGPRLGSLSPRAAEATQQPSRPRRPQPPWKSITSKSKREAAISQATLQEARRLRIAELAADPGKASYVPLMERGEWWTDEQIAYRENPKATATCAHLQPVERAMRAAGIVPRRLTEPWYRGFASLSMVEADCRINQAELPRFHLPGSVQYASGYSPERSEWDNPWARLTCGVCASRIDLVHPEYPRTTTVWFPSPPE